MGTISESQNVLYNLPGMGLSACDGGGKFSIDCMFLSLDGTVSHIFLSCCLYCVAGPRFTLGTFSECGDRDESSLKYTAAYLDWEPSDKGKFT